MIGNPRDLAHDHPNVFTALCDVNTEQFLNRHGVSDVVDQRRHVIQPVRVRKYAIVVNAF